jgi:hypothetical protein
MKKTTKLFFSNLKLYKDIYEASAMISLSNENHLKLVLKEIGMRFVYLSFLRTKDTNRIRSLHNFAMYLIKLRNHHGDMYVIKFLKATQLAIQKKIAGSPFSSLREIEPDLPLPRLTKSGLPLIIKLGDRSAIVRGSLTVIRFWLSLSSLYRVLQGPIKTKLNTITDPFSGDLDVLTDFKKFLWLNARRLLTSFSPHFDLTKLEARRILPIQKASPSSKVSWKGLFHDIVNLDVYLGSYIKEYLLLTNSKRLMLLYDTVVSSDPGYPSDLKPGRHLGQLSFKEEAAGKLRVFAMVDVFTQSLLKPLHDYLFEIFKNLPNDGTHDQSRAFEIAQGLANKYNGSFGFDLSSATDRLPVAVQSYFLSIIFDNHKFGKLWEYILVQRPYFIGNNKYGFEKGDIYYSVGQPMGALSSWAMLNMIHHMMVQYCYCQCYGFNKPWYRDYVILGDDLVIFDPRVAEKYLALCKGLGVEINLSKSVIAQGVAVVEFAKRTGYKGFDVSALSFKDFISNNNFFGRLSIVSRLIDRNWGGNKKLLFILGNGSKKFKTRLSYPIIGYLAQLVDKGVLTYEQILSLLLDSNKPLSYFGRKLESFDQSRASKMFFDYLKGSTLMTVDMSNLWFASRKSKNYKIYLIEEIKKLKVRLENSDSIAKRMDLISKEFNLPDLSIGHHFVEGIMEGYILKLLEFSNKVRWYPFPNFISSPSFNRLTLDELQLQLKEGQSLLSQISFDQEKPERRTKINNSLKLLEFIRNSNNSNIESIVKENPKMVFPTNIFPMFLLKNKSADAKS